MGFKLIHDKIEDDVDDNVNETEKNFSVLLGTALKVSGLKGRHKNALFAKKLKHYAKEKSSNKLNIQFSGKDIQRLLKPKQKRVYTKHSLEIIYYMIQFIVDNNKEAVTFLDNHLQYINEIHIRVTLMDNILQNPDMYENSERVLSVLEWQDDRIRYYMDSLNEYNH